MRTRSVLVALVLAALAGPTAVSADNSPWLLDAGQQAAWLEAGFFSADTYHDPDGDRAYLAGNGLSEQRSGRWKSLFGWKQWSSNVYFDIEFVSATRRLGGSQPPFLNTTTAFGDAHFGILLPIKKGATPISLELDWKTPFGYDRDPTFFTENDTIDMNAYSQSIPPALGDGQMDLSGLLHAGWSLGSRGWWQAGAGYTYRMEAPGDRIDLRSDIGLWLTSSIMVTGRYRGGLAMEGDNPTRDATRHLLGGGLTYRVNDAMDIYAQSLHTAMAENATHTDEIQVGFTFKQTKLNRSQGYLGTLARP